MTVSIVGVGLISGSFALAAKAKGIASSIIGYDTNPHHLQTALQNGIIDVAANSLQQAATINNPTVIYVAIPVDATIEVIINLLDSINDHQIIIDAGSTKQALCEAVANHPRRSQFVASHPMWGTENSGPQAATAQSFSGRVCVICDKEKTSPKAIEVAEKLYTSLGMNLVYMNAQEHDVHAAYISHISHITSFALANTVLEKEKEEEAIFQLAAGGFESTVRLAKSNPNMWLAIFMQNKENVLDVLNEHISQLRKFKSALEKENDKYLLELMTKANKIKKILQ